MANVAPSVSVPTSAIVGEDTSLTFSSGTPYAIALADPWANLESLTLQVNQGTLTFASSSGLSFNNGTTNGSASIAVTGTLANLNAALGELIYTPNSGFVGCDALSLTVTNTSDGQSIPASMPLTVFAPPVASAGPNQTTTPGSVVTLDGVVTYTSIPGQALSTAWQLAGGPGTVTFANSASPQTTATFSAARHVLFEAGGQLRRFER